MVSKFAATIDDQT